jgi:hypothetical protein
MLRILALSLIGYGLFELFIRNFLRSLRAPESQLTPRLTVQMRLRHFRASLPFYAAVLLGAFLLIASFAR